MESARGGGDEGVGGGGGFYISTLARIYIKSGFNKCLAYAHTNCRELNFTATVMLLQLPSTN